MSPPAGSPAAGGEPALGAGSPFAAPKGYVDGEESSHDGNPCVSEGGPSPSPRGSGDGFPPPTGLRANPGEPASPPASPDGESPSARDIRDALARPAASAEFLALDFDAPPERPDYLVDGLIERGTLAVLAGDTGTAKTFLGNALVAAGATGGDWLGREVTARRFLVVDEENPRRVPVARLRALGMTNEHRDALRYASRQGVALGDPQWNDWLRDEVRRHGTDMVLVDGSMAATNVADVNDNSAVVRLYKGLRGIAEAEGVTILLYHHERKAQVGQTRARGQAAMGARQWTGQADAHLELVLHDRSAEPAPNGGRRLRTTVTLAAPKLRDDVPDEARELVAVTSEKDCDGRLLWARVESEGAAEPRPSKTAAMAEAVVAVLRERGAASRAGEIADALGEKVGGTLSKALALAVEGDQVVQVKRGVYALAPPAQEPPL